MGPLSESEIDRVLAEALSVPLSSPERAELEERLVLLRDHVRRVRALDLSGDDPAWSLEGCQ